MGSPWHLRYEGYEPEREGLREALCTLGNGYMATRGAAPESDADGVHYPGTYLAGVFNRLETTIDDVTISNEDMVNQPNWLVLRLHTPDADWMTLDTVEVEDHLQELDLRRGVLTRQFRWQDAAGRRTHVTQRRFVDMAHAHRAALETTVVAENWSGDLTVRSGLDGTVENTGVARYRDLSHHHHDVVRREPVDDETVLLQVETTQSHVRVAQAARTRVHRAGTPVEADRHLWDEDGRIGHDLVVPVAEGEPVTVEKVVAVYSSRDHAIAEAAEQAVRVVGRAGDFDTLLARHVFQWTELWDRFHLEFHDGGDHEVQRILNLHTFHTLQTASPHSIDRDVGVPARGLHGEAYRGHIFWDEIYILPFLTLRLPALTRSLIMYRYRRLDEARAAARDAGHHGAMFPWQSGSDGTEQSQQLHLNPRSGRWLPDNSHLQRHIDHAIAFDVIHYAQVTDDIEFVRYRGGPLLIEIARFLASITSYDRVRDRYRVLGVMGPDEFHEAYPDREEPGLDDNAYTNVMTVWVLMRLRELLDGLPAPYRRDLVDHMDVTREELDAWEAITRRMYVPFHDGVISQFAGYEQLEELDWEAYRQQYGDIQRLDRILESEGDSPNRYKLSKQADVLMLFYLLSADELQEIFDRLGYAWDPEVIPRTIDYYLQRTSHGSTLSGLVHSWVLARRDRESSWELFQQALRSDVNDIQGGTTAEGIHLGAMAGTLDMVQRGYTGLVVRGDVLWLEPTLPDPVHELKVPLHFRGHRLQVTIDDERVRVSAPPSRLPAVTIGYRGRTHTLAAGDTLTFPVEDAPDHAAGHAPHPASGHGAHHEGHPG